MSKIYLLPLPTYLLLWCFTVTFIALPSSVTLEGRRKRSPLRESPALLQGQPEDGSVQLPVRHFAESSHRSVRSETASLQSANHRNKCHSCFDGRLPSNDDGRLPSNDDGRLPSNDDDRLPSSDDDRLPSNYHGRLTSNDDGRLPSNDDCRLPGSYDGRLPSNDHGRLPSSDDVRLPSNGDGRLPINDGIIIICNFITVIDFKII